MYPILKREIYGYSVKVLYVNVGCHVDFNIDKNDCHGNIIVYLEGKDMPSDDIHPLSLSRKLDGGYNFCSDSKYYHLNFNTISGISLDISEFIKLICEIRKWALSLLEATNKNEG